MQPTYDHVGFGKDRVGPTIWSKYRIVGELVFAVLLELVMGSEL